MHGSASTSRSRQFREVPEDNAPGFRRVQQFHDIWKTAPLRFMENSFDNAHFSFVHKGTFGQFDQPRPEKYDIVETDYGFEAETIVTIRNPPNAARITGTADPTTRRHMRNKWYMPFCRRLDIQYPSGIRHIIFNSATPIDDETIYVAQILYRNDTEADCTAEELIAWDAAIIEEDRDVLETTDPDAPIDISRKIEAHMPSDRPGMIMRKRLLELLRSNGEAEITEAPRADHPAGWQSHGGRLIAVAPARRLAVAPASQSRRISSLVWTQSADVPLPRRRWVDMTAAEFSRIPEDTVAVLPVAAIEQHGPHLPVYVDACLNEGVVRGGNPDDPAGAAGHLSADAGGRQIERTSGVSRHVVVVGGNADPRLDRDRRVCLPRRHPETHPVQFTWWPAADHGHRRARPSRAAGECCGLRQYSSALNSRRAPSRRWSFATASMVAPRKRP